MNCSTQSSLFALGRVLAFAAVALVAACNPSNIAAPSELSVRVDPKTMEMTPGDAFPAECNGYNSGEKVKGMLSWSAPAGVVSIETLNPSTVEVDLLMVRIEAVTPGTVNVTCTMTSNVSKTAAVAVTVRPVSATASAAAVTVATSEEKSATLTLRNFRTQPVTGTVVWKSEDAAIATATGQADGSVKIKGVKAGTTTATATITGKEIGSIPVTVQIAVTVTAPPTPTCITTPSTVVFSVQKISDPGGFDGTIGLGTTLSISTQMTATATPGNVQVVGGNKMNGWNVDQVNANGAAPNASNNCSMDLNGGAITFGPGAHKTRLYGNATRTVGTKLTYDFLDFLSGALQTRYEFTVVSVQ